MAAPPQNPSSGHSTPKHHYHQHNNPQFYSSGHVHDDPDLTAEQNAEHLAKYQNDHAAQLDKNLASHGGHANEHHYHQHANPDFYGSGHHQDGPALTAGQNAVNLAKYNQEHAAQLEKNLASHGGHANEHHYHQHNNPEFYGGGHRHDSPTPTAEQNAANLAKYQQEHAAQLEKNLASHGGHTNEHHYHQHKNPDFYGSGHRHDPPTPTAEQNAVNLAKYQQDHAEQLAKNLASHRGHEHEYHPHKNPSFYGSDHRNDPPTPTAEENAKNLAKYQQEHAAQLNKNLVSHGGHVEGDDYTPSRGAHHHPHFHMPSLLSHHKEQQ